jgi:CBS domain-containing protein
LEKAIDRHPIVVAPDTRLEDAIALMSQARRQSCSMAVGEANFSELLDGEARSSCVLVRQSSELVGILTERDIVRLTAERLDVAEVAIAEVMAQPVITLQSTDFQDLFAPLFLFRRYRIRHLPVVQLDGQLIGVISPESIRYVLRPANLLKLRRVSEVMASKVIQASPNTSVFDLACLMAENRVSCVVIVGEPVEDVSLPVGIVTERDIVQFQALGVRMAEIEATEVMSTPLFLLKPSDSLWIAHQEMQQRHVRRLVVSWNWGMGLGIVTQTSLLRIFDPMEMYGVIDTLQRTVEQLEAEKASFSPEEAVSGKEFSDRSDLPLLGSAEREASIPACFKSSLDSRWHPEHKNPILEGETLLWRLQDNLSTLLHNPEMPSAVRQELLQKAVEIVQELKNPEKSEKPSF